MNPKVLVLAGPLCGSAFPIDGTETTIGCDPSAHLSIPDHLMSQRHCAVELDEGRFTLRDLGSSNGTFINGNLVRERILTHGDCIRAGDSVLLFLHANGARKALATPVPGIALGDRTSHIPQGGASDPAPGPVQDSPETIIAEVLAGRVPLQMHDMIGDSPPMRVVYDLIRKAAPFDCTVLIAGETGTGKELAARAIHQNSPRARGPFVAVNCAALSEHLLESELFGHEKGAFTGAVSLKRGKLEIADGGTAFLDEIGDLAPALQAKLLRALQHREFERVGGTRTIKVDVRVVAATNRDLEEAVVATGQFRQDLLYRLKVVTLTMPPLRARRGDIPMLAGHFAAKYGRGRPLTLSREAIDALSAHQWPGNVRELGNAIESAVVLGCSDLIVADDLPEAVLEGCRCGVASARRTIRVCSRRSAASSRTQSAKRAATTRPPPGCWASIRRTCIALSRIST